MSSITHSLQNLLTALFDTILSTFQSVFAVFTTLITQLYELSLGLLNFLLGELFFRFWRQGGALMCLPGNILIIGVLVAAFVGYTLYAQKQGGRVKAGKSL